MECKQKLKLHTFNENQISKNYSIGQIFYAD